MHFSIKKAKATAIIVTVLMMTSIMIMANAPANAQLAEQQPIAGPLPSGVTPSITIGTIPYLSFTPNPIGIGQQMLVNIWMQPPIHVERQLHNAMQVTFTKPDGTKDVIGPITSFQGDATAWFPYVPDTIGNWTVRYDFLGIYFPAGRYLNGYVVANSSGSDLGSAYYSLSSTGEQPLVVQQEAVKAWPGAALPTDYWTRPVSPELREWWPLLGNYPGTGYGPALYTGGNPSWDELYPNTNPYWGSQYNFVPYAQAPSSAHIVWKRQGDIGGLLGGVLGQLSLRPDPGYPSIIYAGRCYQVVTKVFDGVTQNVWQCYDLRTGEVFWEKTGVTQVPTAITYTDRSSQAVEGEDAMHRGLEATLLFIGGGRMIKYNPWNGAVTTNVSISPLTTGTYYLHEYALSVQTIGSGATTKYFLINWTTNGNLANLTTTTGTRIISNISYPVNSLPATIDYNAGIAVSTSSINPPSPSGTGVSIGQRLVGINIRTGAVMWNVTAEDPGGHSQFFSGNTAVADHGKFVARMISGEIRAWDLYTGQVAWGTQLSYPWGVFGAYHVASAYGLYFCNSYDGVHGINFTNGKDEWTFHAYTPYQFETPYQGPNGEEYAFHIGIQVADGKVYVSSAEHTPSQPETRGLKLYCLNAITGEQIWNYSASQLDQSRTFTGAIADGYLAFASQYDSIMYVFGKGLTQTTVEAPLTAVAQGDSIVVKGTVLDMSPAQPGTPCVSEASMSAWMEHLQMQLPHPVGTTGVPVSIDALDPAGNYRHIADVTSDVSGTFSYLWTPELTGIYSVTATFAGSNSYSSSYGETPVGVVKAPAIPTTPEIPTPVDNTMLLYGILVAVIVAIILALVAIIAIFRKR
jgi:hypothetical protein